MHQDVGSAQAGECPICRMALEPATGGARSDARPGAVGASTYQTYDFVRRRGFGQDVCAPAWVDDDGSLAALLYADELPTATPERVARFYPSASSGVPIDPHTTLDLYATAEAPQRWDGSTWRVRFVATAGAAAPGFRARDVGWLRMTAARYDVTVVPSAAVLQGAEGPYVLVASPDGRTLTRRAIELGRVIGDVAVVVSGVRFLERIAVRSAFFLDAERRLRRTPSLELGP